METVPLLALAILVLIGGTIVIGCLVTFFLRKLAWARIIGLVLVFVGVAAGSGVLFAVGHFGEWSDMNPPDVRDQDVATRCVSTGLLAPHQIVTFRIDGTFSLVDGQHVNGRWTRSDWNFRVWPSGERLSTGGFS